MQITINCSQLSIPTHEPYDKKDPNKQRENLAYVGLQLFLLAKQAGVKVTYTDDADVPTGLKLDGIEQATNALKWNGQVIDVLGLFKITLINGGRGVAVEWEK